jgi:molybdopterin synthase catalytic subunit
VIDVRIQSADFDPGRQIRRLEELGAGVVASVTLADRADPAVDRLTLDHYPALARNELGRIAAEAESRFGLGAVILIHRHGQIASGDRIAFAAVASEEAKTALDGCAWLAEALRTRAPFWRCETLADGRVRWP